MSLIDGLISYYKFDENTSTVVGDSIGSNAGGWHGTLGSQWATGIINSGGNFNGTNNYVLIANNSILGGLKNASISLWMKNNSSSVASTFDIYNERAAAGNDLFRVEVSVTDKFYKFSIRDDAGNLKQLTNNSTILTDNIWHNLIITKQLQNVVMYIDGGVNFTANISPVSDTWTNASIQTAIGAFSAGATEFFPGLVDEVGLWSVVLTPNEVKQLYNSGAGLQYPFLGTPIFNKLRPRAFGPGLAR